MANIVVCADGTWNRPEEDIQKDFPTNVLKIARAITPATDTLKQHVFYDWGLGSYHDRLMAGTTGRGIHKNILDGYRYIIQNYSDGDRIYLFGFSRGAYTVRALCGLINNCGILHRSHANLIPQAWKIYKSPSDSNHPDGVNSKQFRADYCHKSNAIHFVGVWDTVGALGIPFSILGLFDRTDEFYDTKMGSNVAFARHAMAIDEQREDFEPTIWTQRKGVDLKQVWFAGVHSDIGGSYPPDKDTNYLASDVPLSWMMDEASMCGLILESHLGESLTEGEKGKLHQSRKYIYRFKKPLHRELMIDNKPTRVHPSVKARYERDPDYRPPRLKNIVEKIGWENILAN